MNARDTRTLLRGGRPAEPPPCPGSGEQRGYAPTDVVRRSDATGADLRALTRCTQCRRSFTGIVTRGEYVTVPRHRPRPVYRPSEV